MVSVVKSFCKIQESKIVPTFRQIYLSPSGEVKGMQIAVVSSIEIYMAFCETDEHFFVHTCTPNKQCVRHIFQFPGDSWN